MGLLIFDVSLHEKIGSLQDILRVKEKRRYRRQREKLQIKGGRKMRITTQMLANSAAKSGIPIQRTSLLDIINNKSSQNLLGTIGKSMNTTSTGATDILRKIIMQSWRICRRSWANLRQSLQAAIRIPSTTRQKRAETPRTSWVMWTKWWKRTMLPWSSLRPPAESWMNFTSNS